MTKKHSSITDALRRCTEIDPGMDADTNSRVAFDEETTHLVHELRMHQIELEMKNEALRVAKTELQNLQVRYFELYELAPVGYLTLDQKGLIIESNLTATALLSVKKSPLVNCPLSQFITPEHQDAYNHYYQQLLAGRGPQNCELCLLRGDGQKIWISLGANLMKDEADEIFQVRCTVSDITERKQAEQRLLDSEERLALAMDVSGEGLWDWDIENDLAIHNHKWYELLGLDGNKQETSATFFTRLLHQDDRESVLSKLRQAIEGDGQFHSEHRLQRSDGHFIWVVENGIVVKRDEAGKPLRMVGSFADISERKRAEQQQRELQKHYERLLQLQVVNQTIAAIAHDLNQPLSAAASYADAVQNLLRKEDYTADKAMYILDQVEQQIQRAGWVVHDLFNFLHKGETVTEPIDLNQMVRDVIDKLKEDVCLRGFREVLELTQGLPKVCGNTLQLEMVLTNLIRNAIEAMEVGRLSSDCFLFTVCTTNSDSCAHLSVKDSGPGIPEKNLQRIFEAFFSTKLHGLGMGLAISRALIEAQGGQLWCESDAGSGATFHLTIPFVTETSL